MSISQKLSGQYSWGPFLLQCLSPSITLFLADECPSISGISDLQAMFYYRSYKRDPTGMKFLVAGVWLLDLFHTGLVWGSMWVYLIDNYGQSEKIDDIPWCIALTIVVTALITVFVHLFLAHRIFALSGGNWFMTAPVVLLTCFRLACACVTGVKMFHYQSFALWQLHAGWILTLGLAVSATLDVVTSGLLVYLILSHRTEAGRLNRVLDRIMLYGLECGSLTCIGSIASMLCWIIMPHNLIFMGLYFPIGKLYANSLFAILNTRNDIRLKVGKPTSELKGSVLLLEPRVRFAKDEGQTQSGDPSGKVPTELQMAVHTQTDVRYESIAGSRRESYCAQGPV
ncbi:hypothetical protein DFH07DRAFT_407786 [Mycena maculata]|uniref:DUF6534 domain-containing protein n=1 Tax=Mycena maculata TaxID=230809 RepID=A0AAD7JD01_9AGAR|nr:hypothetical protein DFH07DRAFT_407786 [Mycena maculata]